jgi:hypothetical protein
MLNASKESLLLAKRAALDRLLGDVGQAGKISHLQMELADSRNNRCLDYYLTLLVHLLKLLPPTLEQEQVQEIWDVLVKEEAGLIAEAGKAYINSWLRANFTRQYAFCLRLLQEQVVAQAYNGLELDCQAIVDTIGPILIAKQSDQAKKLIQLLAFNNHLFSPALAIPLLKLATLCPDRESLSCLKALLKTLQSEAEAQ